MTVEIKPEQEAFVSTIVSSGQYSSVAEAVEEALRLLEDRNRYGIHNYEIIDAMQSSPHRDIDIEIERDKHVPIVRDLPSFE